MAERTMSTSTIGGGGYELRFRSLVHDEPGYSFPCDPSGRVDMDRLGEQARSNYFFARTVIGRCFAAPAVLASSVA
jgi:hypothetical protein